MSDRLPESVMLLGNSKYYEYDLYWIFYPEGVISRDKRIKLKEAGWNLQRHTRTNEEIWVFDKKEAVEKYQKELEEQKKERANGSHSKTS